MSDGGNDPFVGADGFNPAGTPISKSLTHNLRIVPGADNYFLDISLFAPACERAMRRSRPWSRHHRRRVPQGFQRHAPAGAPR